MKILSMTATFGKLENQTITFREGLNAITAPNEWGKSTWCAFLTIMLYGLDTRAKTTKTTLADKERYAPWSGAPMSGRMELIWQDRNITIERRAKGRIPMGDFSAYETHTGLPVPELTAANCGQTLLGVERSVFQRAGFIQLSDLPVTQDDSLRRRLNALVTTGDESSDADDLAQKLKDLKNKCRYNRLGLLPQAEAQREALEQTLSELTYLQGQCQKIKVRQQELEAQGALLENHKQALAYEAARQNAQRVAQAGRAKAQAAQQLQASEEACQNLPAPQIAQQQLDTAKALQMRLLSMQAEPQPLPPTQPQAPLRYALVPPENAVEEAMKDVSRDLALNKKKQRNSLLLGLYAGISVLLLAALAIPQVRPMAWLIGAVIALGGMAVAAICILRTRKIQKEIEKIYDLHPGQPPHTWLPEAESYQKAHAAYLAQRQSFDAWQASFRSRKAALDKEIEALAGEKSLQAILDQSSEALAAWEALELHRRDYQQALAHAEALETMVKPAQPPSSPDTLALSEPETLRLLSDTSFELRQLHTRLGQCQGKMEALGSQDSLQRQLEAVNDRIRQLTDTYNALDLGLQTLASARAELQRRFAPRISQQAQQIFSQLTGGKYSRLTLSEDLTVSAGSLEETTLRPALWRSEGTIDQLYLSLRLAVARELTPQAPLILDDAFARFDQDRLSAAMALLQQESQNRQVILFSCQDREARYLEEMS